MLEKIKEIAMEKFAGDESAAQDFVNSFADTLLEKTASPRAGHDSSFGDSVSRGFAGAIGKGVGGMAVGLGMHGLSAMVNSVKQDRLHGQFLEALQEAISSSTVLRGANKDKVRNYAETIFRFAPHVATDSNLLATVLAHVVHGEGIDPDILKRLTDLESRFTESASAPAFSPKAYV